MGRVQDAMRRAAAQALGELRAARATAALRALSQDTDVEVRKAAARALEAIGRNPDLTNEEN